MLLTLYVSASENDVIGADNQLIWRLPKDFKRMKERTAGKPLIMGRKTHESIGRALPGRLNIVVTRDAARHFDGCETVTSLEEAIARAKATGADETFVFGGGEIYRAALPLVDRIDMTRVHAQADGDATFPSIDPSQWKGVFRERHEADAEHPHAFTFLIYERVR